MGYDAIKLRQLRLTPKRPPVKCTSIVFAASVLALLATPLSSAPAVEDSEQKGVNNAHRFLKTGQSGRYTLGYISERITKVTNTGKPCRSSTARAG